MFYKNYEFLFLLLFNIINVYVSRETYINLRFFILLLFLQICIIIF